MNQTPISPYDDAFYAAQVEESLVAGRIYAERLAEVFQPRSVLDIGCGRGAWLKAFAEAGATRLVGLDGTWNKGALVDPSIDFRSTDLEDAAHSGWDSERFDLALSVEVAEHLSPECSRGFAKILCDAADVVIFGAAIPHQSGTRHINLRRQSAWAADFAAQGFDPWDLFRPALWGHEHVPYWYQQNTFLYVKRGSAIEAAMRDLGIPKIERHEIMDVVHPELLTAHADLPAMKSAKRLAKLLLPDVLVRRLTREGG